MPGWVEIERTNCEFYAAQVIVRRCIPSGSPYEQTVGFSRAVKVATPVGAMVHVAGTAPVWPGGTVDPDPLVQARWCWAIALGALAEAGGEPASVVRTRTFLTDRAYEAAASRAHGELFAEIRPASTMLVVAGLLDPRWLVEVELDAYLDPDPDLDPLLDPDPAPDEGPGA